MITDKEIKSAIKEAKDWCISNEIESCNIQIRGKNIETYFSFLNDGIDYEDFLFNEIKEWLNKY